MVADSIQTEELKDVPFPCKRTVEKALYALSLFLLYAVISVFRRR
jgi:hypothetical protein